MKGFLVFSAVLVVAFAKPGGLWGPAVVANWGVSTGAVLAGPQSTGAILDGPKSTGAILQGPSSAGAVVAQAALPGAVVGLPGAVVGLPVAAPWGGVVTNGGGIVGVSHWGATVSGPPTAPAVISGPSGRVAADGLWGPTLAGLPVARWH